MVSRREILVAAGAGALASAALSAKPARAQDDGELVSLTADAQPITAAERLQRVARLQDVLREAGAGALLMEAGSAMDYFTGVRWWLSERLTAVIVPAEGQIGIVTPEFEEPSIREQLDMPADIRVWNEHQSPFERVAGFLEDAGAGDRPLALEATTRHFVVNGLANAGAGDALITGEPFTRACRMHKSPAELALMQLANDVTLAAYRHTYARIETGMSPADIRAIMNAAQTALGGQPTFALVLIGESAAYPHGSNQPQIVEEGQIILMDCGCDVHGYKSDISRTWAHGAATDQQRRVWDTVKRGQEIVMEEARIGRPAGEVDDMVRAHYESEGWGPGYALPGLSHRTGHGIGMDIHEEINFVHGETTPLAAGMCFSNEPGLYLPGQFGVRHEDCIYMTEDGPRLFTPLSSSIDNPFA